MVVARYLLLLLPWLGVGNLVAALCAQCTTFVEQDFDIVVIGAGMAGLTAAFTIENSSSKSYVLLEAKDKVGGKMQAAFAAATGLGVTVEDGANWIGGYSPNPMFDLAVEFGLRVFQHDFANFRSFTGEGRRITQGAMNKAFVKFDSAYTCLDEAGQKIYDDFLAGNVTPDISVQEQLKKCGWIPKDSIDDFVSWFYTDYSTHASTESTAISVYPDYTFKDFLDTKNKYNEYLVVDERGFQHIPTKFAEEKLRQSPLKNTEVCHVTYDATGAKVETITSTTCTCTRYKAKKVISTISPNIYRFNTALFSPSLDMTRSPFHEGDYQKVFYRFPRVFWDITLEFINVVLPTDHRGECGWFHNLDYYRRYVNGHENNQLPYIVDDEMWPGSHVLFCLIITDAVEKLGGTITETIAMTFLEPLKKIFPDYDDPEEVYIPNWNVDRYSYGPIYWKAGFGLDDLQDFLSQGQPTIHISGAHTCRRYDGWTHGAYYAGIRTANIVLDQLGVPDIDTESICDLSTSL